MADKKTENMEVDTKITEAVTGDEMSAEKVDLKKANRYFLTKMLFNLVLIIVGSLAISLFLTSMQKADARARHKEESILTLEEVAETLEQNEEDAEELTALYHKSNQQTVDDLQALLTGGLFDYLGSQSRTERCAVFRDIIERTDVPYLLVIDEKGTCVLSPEINYIDKDLIAADLLSEENLKVLIAGTENHGKVTPVYECNDKGEFYFYSAVIHVKDQKYAMLMGADVYALDLQLDALKDVGSILKRSMVANGGFLFAVDDSSHDFLYYETDNETLTGMNAEECGMTPEALTDGYSGVQTINGTPYYCVTRVAGGETIVCAAASETVMYGSNRYILFWSILGFVLVMLMCLAYAVIVRNDFVNRQTETEKYELFKLCGNQIMYDRTLGRKIFPLMVAGVIIIFLISFYTQTLLEISDTVGISEVAISEVNARYAESEESRTSITDYYNSSYLAKARLLAYLLEEDPRVLNEGRENVYVEYNEDHQRYYLKDDEGNQLKAVGDSRILNKLCEENDLQCIYIYDENGRTIATSMDSWYFILGYEEEQQSTPFRDVIDGKKEHLIQEPTVNDLGEHGQYIGVAFHYYMTLDDSGDTLYVSRYAYENSQKEGYEGKPVTAHRSMLQIGLNEELVSRLLATTDVQYIFSTDVLRTGFIVLFDSTDEHQILYSPNPSSIGKTAEQIGVSEKAFADEYYGFQRVNGTEYFQYYSYRDGYYIATAIPKGDMYRSRMPIALMTALVSLLLIMFLMITVTFTSSDEEKLFMEVSDEFRNVKDAAVFNMILPSGMVKRTTNAAARWDNSRVSWKNKAPEQKLMSIFEGVMAIILFYILVSVVGAGVIFPENSVIHYILAGGWDRGLNIFALSACVLVLIMIVVVINLFKIPVRLAALLLGARTETIGRLLLSVVKYGSVLAGFFYCLYLLGLDASSLIASAGILSLVIGLGAQSLIKDVIAGIFIVFEGDFRVGDIVTISDFRGTVMDIGLRTAKIMNVEGNIKIFNNSEISGVLNMTKQESFASCMISIAYGQDIDYVEEVLKRELPKIGEKEDLILDGPDYLGVKKLSESSVDLVIIAKCKEAYVGKVSRILNKEILKIFYEHKIGVPFPNITISYLEHKNHDGELEPVMENQENIEGAQIKIEEQIVSIEGKQTAIEEHSENLNVEQTKIDEQYGAGTLNRMVDLIVP